MNTEIDNHEIDEDAAFDAAVSSMSGESDLPLDVLDEPQDEPEETQAAQGKELGQLDETPAWLSTIPPDARDHFENMQAENRRLNHSLSSQIGRTKAAEQRWRKAQDQLAQLESAGADIEQLMASDDEFAEDYPELAEALNSRMGKTLGKFQERLDAVTRPFAELVKGEVEQLSQAQLQDNITQVTDAVPDAYDIIKNPAFDNWLKSQPIGVQNMAAGNDVADAVYVLNQFKASSPGNAIKKRRESQLGALSSVQHRVAGRGSEFGTDDEDALFDAAVASLHRGRK